MSEMCEAYTIRMDGVRKMCRDAKAHGFRLEHIYICTGPDDGDGIPDKLQKGEDKNVQ